MCHPIYLTIYLTLSYQNKRTYAASVTLNNLIFLKSRLNVISCDIHLDNGFEKMDNIFYEFCNRT